MANYPDRCQHIKVNGTQCGSPALRRNRFCFFHKRFQDQRRDRRRDFIAGAIDPDVAGAAEQPDRCRLVGQSSGISGKQRAIDLDPFGVGPHCRPETSGKFA